jgi:hypothetical protein
MRYCIQETMSRKSDDDIYDYSIPVIPKGRDLFDEEIQAIDSWPQSRQDMFRLTKQYGDPRKIPKEELDRVHQLALSELKAMKRTVKPVPIPSPQTRSVHFSDPSVSAPPSEASKKMRFNALWEAFPKRANPTEGQVRGLELAKKRIKTAEQFEEAMRVIANYAEYVKKQYPNKADASKFTVKFDNFITRIEEYAGLPDANSRQVHIEKQRVQRPWVRPYRPFYPWEASPGDTEEMRDQKKAMSLTAEEKKKIELDFKEKEGYNDRLNDKWWYEV